MDGVLACPADDCGRLNVEEADECCYCGHPLRRFSYYCGDCGTVNAIADEARDELEGETVEVPDWPWPTDLEDADGGDGYPEMTLADLHDEDDWRGDDA